MFIYIVFYLKVKVVVKQKLLVKVVHMTAIFSVWTVTKSALVTIHGRRKPNAWENSIFFRNIAKKFRRLTILSPTILHLKSKGFTQAC